MLDIIESSASGLINDDSNTADYDIESSFSVISDFREDDFSCFSFCDDLGDTEIVPTVRCYKHSRNVKLNRFLDFAVILSFAIVTGLGIGNFIGHTTNCIIPSPLMNKFHCPSDLNTAKLAVLSNKLHTSGVKQSLDSMEHKSATLMEGLRSYINEEDQNKINNNHIFVETKNMSKKYEEPFSDTVHNASAVIIEPALHHSLMVTGEKFIQKFYFSIDLKHDVRKSTGLHLKISEESSYVHLIGILNTGIEEVVQKMQNLVSTVISKEAVNSDSLRMVENMFGSFLHSVRGKITELNSFVAGDLFENSASGRKQFMKMAYTVIKSVDKLLEKSFVKTLVKNKKPLNYRLKSICDIGSEVLGNLEKKWSGQKKKLLSYTRKRRNYDSFQNMHKMKQHKFGTRDCNFKQNYWKVQMKPQKQHFHKKKY